MFKNRLFGQELSLGILTCLVPQKKPSDVDLAHKYKIHQDVILCKGLLPVQVGLNWTTCMRVIWVRLHKGWGSNIIKSPPPLPSNPLFLFGMTKFSKTKFKLYTNFPILYIFFIVTFYSSLFHLFISDYFHFIKRRRSLIRS